MRVDNALRESLQQLFQQEKIKAIPGLRISSLPRLKVFHVTTRLIGRYLLERDLLKEIPALEPLQPAAGLEERVGILVLPEVAAVAGIIPTDRVLKVLLWNGQPIPPGVATSAIVRLGPEPSDFMASHRTVISVLRKQAEILWIRPGVSTVVVAHLSGRQPPIDMHHAPWESLRVVEVAVELSNVEEALTRLTEAAEFTLDDLGAAARRVRDEAKTYGGML